jgi:hypothetical protein
VTDFLGDAKFAQWRFHTAFFGTDAKPRAGNRIGPQYSSSALQNKALVANRNVDLTSDGTLHEITAGLNCACL